MLDTLLGLLGNSHFEAYIAGPILGAIAGAIFSGLGSRPPEHDSRSALSPRQAQHTIERHFYRTERRPSDNDASGLLAGGALLLLVTSFLFAAYLPQLAFALNVFIVSVAMFAFTACSLALITRQFNTAQWWLLSVFPIVISVGCFWVALTANRAISPEVVAFAQSLVNRDRLTLSSIINGAIAFFRGVNSDYMQWIMFEMLAFVCDALCALVALLQCVHFVALSNTRVSDAETWRVLAMWSSRFGTVRSALFAIFMLAFAWILASGSAYQFLHS
jgi:hypothetical protein